MSTTETTTTCSRHPKVETNLRCASCGTLICPRCLVQTPVGAKCRDCSSQKGIALYTLSPLHAALAIVTGVAFGAVLGWGVAFDMGFLTLFLAFAYGGFAGEMIMRSCGRKRGIKLEIIAGVAMALGAVGGRLVVAMIVLPPGGTYDVMRHLVQPDPIPLIALGVAVAATVSRIRYI